eukprot:jgi/Galph1/5536/GphlegSOOS_G4187.1
MEAVEKASMVLPVYCFDPRQFGKTSFGFEKTGRYRAQFLIESVEDLRQSLRAKNSDLIVRHGRPEEVLPELCRQNREVTYEDLQVEESVEEALKNIGVELTFLWSNTLYQTEDLPFEIENMPDIYTKFRESLENKGRIRDPLELPEPFPRRPRCEPGDIPSFADLGLDNSVETMARESLNPRGVHGFKGGESESLKRMENYLSEMKNTDMYASANAYLGADFSCKISPWLALGCISPRKIYHEICQSVTPADIQKTTYFELVWRDFFRFITLKYGNIRLSKSRHSAVTSGRQESAKSNSSHKVTANC